MGEKNDNRFLKTCAEILFIVRKACIRIYFLKLESPQLPKTYPSFSRNKILNLMYAFVVRPMYFVMYSYVCVVM